MLNYFDSRPSSTSTVCGGNADRATLPKNPDVRTGGGATSC